MLGGVVVPAARERQPPSHRPEVDDLAPALRAHLSQHQLGQAHDAEVVGLELAPHRVHGNRLDGSALAVAGVVDQHADRTLGLLYTGDRGAHRMLVGDVQRERAAACLRELNERLRAARRGVHGPARASQTQRGRAADPRRAAGDQHGLRALSHRSQHMGLPPTRPSPRRRARQRGAACSRVSARCVP